MKTFENTQIIIDEMQQIRFLFYIYTSIRLDIVYTVSCQGSVVKLYRKNNVDDNGLMMQVQQIKFFWLLFLTSKMIQFL